MKKILTFIISSLMLLQPIGALAEEQEITMPFTLTFSNTANEITKIETGISEEFIAVIYDENGRLYSTFLVNSSSELQLSYPDGKFNLRLYYNIGSDDYISYDWDSSLIPNVIEPDIEQQPPQENKYPAVYESGAVAVGAFAVVKNVEEVLDENNDVINRVTIYYMGKETYLDLEDSFPFENAWSYSDISSISELCEGDIIKIQTDLSGDALGIKLLFRNFDYDLLDTEEGKKLFSEAKENISDKSVIFGVITNRFEDNTIVLSDETGLDENAKYLYLHPETVVYYYDSSEKHDKLTISDINKIKVSKIYPDQIDDDYNIIEWDTDAARHYLYARVHDDKICDVVVYGEY